jgi:hypothetical protein
VLSGQQQQTLPRHSLSLTHSLTHSLTPSLPHSLTYRTATALLTLLFTLYRIVPTEWSCGVSSPCPCEAAAVLTASPPPPLTPSLPHSLLQWRSTRRTTSRPGWDQTWAVRQTRHTSPDHTLPLTHPLTHPLTQPLTHPPTHPLTPHQSKHP